jgi:hypothetical protein
MPKDQSASKEQQDQYAASVLAHSKRSKDRYLYPGTNYRQFADFLVSNPSPSTGLKITPTTFVIVHSINSESKKTVAHFQDHLSHNPTCALPPLTPDCSQLIFIKGFASPAWLRAIGAQYKIDPEYFRRHLDFIQVRGYHESLPLPSNARNVVRLRVTDIFARQVTLTQQQIREARAAQVQDVRNYQRQLRLSKISGETIIRKLSIHDETLFTMEYDISICVKRAGHRGWTSKSNASLKALLIRNVALIWMDVGRDLTQCPKGPWIDAQSQALQAVCAPIIQHRPKLALERLKSHESAIPPATSAANLLQSGSHLPTQYGSSLDPALMRVDAIYALSEVFSFAANSEHHLLDVIAGILQKEIEPLDTLSSDHPIDNMKHTKALLDDHIERLAEVHRILVHRRNKKWPSASNEDTNLPKSDLALLDETHANLASDYEALLNRARKLSALCVENMSIIANDSMLYESRRCLEASHQTRRLTLLAFCYLPLSLTTSIYGMNFKELGQGKQSIWLAFVTGFPIILTSAVIYYWDKTPWSAKNRRLRKSRRQLAAARTSFLMNPLV